VGRIYVPTQGPDDWKRLLADPELHWKQGRSARTLAHCWEDADGFPASFAAALGQAGLGMEILVAIPEHKVPLPGGRRASQTDLFLLARTDAGALATVAVEGKAGESFGPLVRDWLKDDQGGKRERLASLTRTLGLETDDGIEALRYQLLHRTASAVLEAHRCTATTAMMVVHAFTEDADSWGAYQAFARLLGADPERGSISRARHIGEVALWLGWIDGEQEYLQA
jgi:GrpB-like predicted nucleotidyltransferase (UPF0157 family)